MKSHLPKTVSKAYPAYKTVGVTLLSLIPLVAYSLQTPNTSQIQQSQAQPTDISESQAEHWGITTEEYKRYTKIMEGPLKHWNPSIDPVLALGIYAETEVVQQRFAEIYARQEYQLVSRTQVFERAYRQAFQKLYPNAEMVSKALMAPYYTHRSEVQPQASPLTHNTLADGDRLLMFVKVNNRKNKKSENNKNKQNKQNNQKELQHIQRLLIKKWDLSADIYLRGVSEERDARCWAKENAIDIQLVNEGRLTINVDAGFYQEVSASSQQSTPFYLQRQGQLFAVSRADILSQ